MANSLATLAPAQLIAQRILDTLLEEYPFLQYIGGDYSAENAEFGRAIKVQCPTAFTAGTYSRANGYAPIDAAQSEFSVTINKHPYVTYSFDDQERSSTAVPLIERFAQAGAAAIGSAVVHDLMALVISTSYASSTSVAVADFNRQSVITMGKALNVRKVPSVGRVTVLNSDYYGALCEDTTLVANPGSPADTVRSGSLGNVHGFRTFEYPQLPDNAENLAGFALQPGALLVATRLPTPPADGTFAGDIAVVRDDKSGLALQVRTWYDALKGQEFRTFTLMYGVAVGDAARMQRLVAV